TYVRSGEINSRLENVPQKLSRIESHYSGGQIDHLDGLTVDFGEWWFNLRPSNTEPLLRLNVEAASKKMLDQKTAELLDLIRS
ncbi:MAG: phosphomannomutase/phosphoglucomutase, partial [Candidatus Zixiibacteriota bacterium]